MAKYVIGDIQGCYTQLMQLLDKLQFNKGSDTIYLVGDLVNRGPQSLEVLHWAYSNQDSVVTILGNHDIYLLARYANIRSAIDGDTLGDILTSKHAKLMIDWLRSCPLIYQDAQYLLVHAGIYPKIDLNQMLLLSHQISQQLQSPNYAKFIDDIYGNKPNKWSSKLDHIKQMKFIINACTRMRYLELPNYELNYTYKNINTDKRPASLIPWFEVNPHSTIDKTIIFGHWAALGLFIGTRCICLDSGCVWGGKLSALNLQTLEVTQV